MNINSVSPSANSPLPATASATGQTAAVAPSSSETPVPSDSVQLSSAAVTAHSADATAKSGAAATASASGMVEPSPVKSFVYGALNLEKPQAQSQTPQAETPAQKTDDYYEDGKVMAAAVTVGAMISLFA
jgi:outer membrane receptor protein involved in Fe transport